MKVFPAPSPRYLGPAKYHGSKTNKPIDRIVIHGTVTPCLPGWVRAVARYFRESVIRPSSAHYVVGPAGQCQVVYDSVVAYGAPPNPHSIHIELCDPQRGKGSRWHGIMHRRMLNRAAKLTAQLCLANNVPVIKLHPYDLRLGRRGICGHVDVSLAFHETTHTDPGPDFPWDEFIARVHTWVTKLEKR